MLLDAGSGIPYNYEEKFVFIPDPNWVSKAVYLSEERLAKLDEDLANMTVTDEELAASLTDEAINALPDTHGCVITWIESITGEETE